jgi:hypothetical protein
MRKEDLESVKSFLREAGKPIPWKDVEKHGVSHLDINTLEIHRIVYVWYELKNKEEEPPTDQFLPSLHRDSAKSIIKFLKTANRVVSRHELMDTLRISENDVKYIAAHLAPQYFTEYLSLAPDANCESCFFRGNCEKKRTADKSGGFYNGRKPEENCGLWRDDWRLSPQGETK